jgi:nucleoside 2-deoxyribosyltransferase
LPYDGMERKVAESRQGWEWIGVFAKMRKYRIYLAGPITGLSYKGATDWREWFINHLPPEIEGMSPLRGKYYLEGEDEIAAEYANIALSCAKGIVTRDHFDCMNCDLILVNLVGAERVSIGTVMEIAWAWAYRKPLILIMEDDGNIHEHAMLTECSGYRVKKLEEALILTNAILLPVSQHSQ